MIVSCPSGLIVELRPLKTKEANILANQQVMRKGATLDELLKSLWVRTLDAGPAYPNLNVTLPLDWSTVLTGDRFYAQLQVRVATHGPDYDFRVPCQVCHQSIDWGLDLTQLPLQMLSAEDAAVFANGNKFKVIHANNEEVTFHLTTGAGERRAQALMKQHQADPLTAGVLSRIDAVVVNGAPVVSLRGWVENLQFNETLDLIAAMDKHSCGVDTSIEIACSECGAQNETELPLGQVGFWMPKRATK
jgi:hypothetical protein